MIAKIFDQSSDIGFIFGMGSLMIEEMKNGNDYFSNVNALYLFALSLNFFLFYRITSSIMVYIGTKNIWYAIGQFFFEYMLYRSIYVNHRLQCQEPSSGQKWIQNMESMLEAFPQLILQMFYIFQIGSGNVEWFVMISIVFSMLSMVNKAVSEDKALFRYVDWLDAEWTSKRFPCVNPRYLLRVFFRVFEISCRVLIIVIIWYEFGGLILFIIVGVEFVFLFFIVFKTKEFSFFFVLCVMCCF